MFEVFLITFGISLTGVEKVSEIPLGVGEEARLLCEAQKHRKEFTAYVPQEYLTLGFTCEIRRI